MPVPLLNTFLFNLIYPAALTAFGVGANAYILRGEMEEVKGDLKEVRYEVKEMVKEVRYEVKDLTRLQAALGSHDMALAEKFFQDCVKRN